MVFPKMNLEKRIEDDGDSVQRRSTPHREWNSRDPSTGNAALPTPGGEQTLGLGVKGGKLVIVVTGNLSLF